MVGLLLLAVVLSTTAATLTAASDVVTAGVCYKEQPADPETASELKAVLIKDLQVNTPRDVFRLYYCNQDTWKGVTMWGYADCARLHMNGLEYCTDCLSMVGEYLIRNCNGTGSGYARDHYNFCSLKVGFSSAICF